MHRILLLFAGLHCMVHLCYAQDSITVKDAKAIKSISETIVERYFNNLLNTISYADAESSDIKDMITRSFEDSNKRIFLNNQIVVADDVSDPDYSRSSNAPDIPITQYLNAVNTFYGKSDSNSVSFSGIRSSAVKKGKKNLYINVYFSSIFKNKCLSKPSIPYKPTNRVAEMSVKRSTNNKWLVYISRIGFFNPADTLNDFLDNIAIAKGIKQTDSSVPGDETMSASDKFSQYIDQARLAEKKRNYQEAIDLYTKAINLAPEKRDLYEPRIKDLNTTLMNLTEPDEKYKEGDYKAAIKGFTQLLKTPQSNSNYSNSDYYLGRAKCFDKMGQTTNSYNEQVKNYHEALKDYDKSLEYDNDNTEAIQSRADLYKRMNGSTDVKK